jgi:hypothetical protein
MRGFRLRAARDSRNRTVPSETHILVDLYATIDEQPSSTLAYERLLEVWDQMGEDGKSSL